MKPEDAVVALVAGGSVSLRLAWETLDGARMGCRLGPIGAGDGLAEIKLAVEAGALIGRLRAGGIASVTLASEQPAGEEAAYELQ